LNHNFVNFSRSFFDVADQVGMLNWLDSGAVWADGDFTGDGMVDARDLNLLALNWRKAAEAPAAARVPRAPLAAAIAAPKLPVQPDAADADDFDEETTSTNRLATSSQQKLRVRSLLRRTGAVRRRESRG
jgi:hypothetical protein